MRIGFRLPAEPGLVIASLQRIARGAYQSLRQRHEVVFLPPEYLYLPAAERARMAEAFVDGCDVVIGVMDGELLAARRRLGRGVPFILFTYADLAGGGWKVRGLLPDLTTRDVLAVNCTAEAEVGRRLLHNATIRVVPLAYDAAAFYPLDGQARREARRRLRFGDDDRIVLYAGRITLDKQVHALLRVFEVVRARVPNAHLVLAGSVERAGVARATLEPFGVVPVSLPDTVSRLLARAEAPERIRVLGPQDDRGLRELYNVADVAVNLTLNPDENFGLAQVEAMACGTPVVGTSWGGLKDTILDGATGWRVTVVPTPSGLRLSWWEAVNRIVHLLEDGEARAAMRERCVREVPRWSADCLGVRMEEVLHSAAAVDGPAEPVRPTAFAQELWSVCDPRLPGAPYRRGARAEELHRELVAPFTGASPAHVRLGEPLDPAHVLSLATPVEVDDDGRVRPEDVFSPLPVEVPARHREAVRVILDVMREEPAFAAGELAGTGPDAMPEMTDALWWMIRAGLVLRTRPEPGWLAPETVDRRLAQPAFSVREFDGAATDLLVYR